MARLTFEEKEDIIFFSKKWLNPKKYTYFKEINSVDALKHYEIRAILFDVFTNGNEKIKSLFFKESTIGGFYKLITSGKIHNLSEKELSLSIKKLRETSKYNEKEKKYYGLKSIKPLTWGDLQWLSLIHKEKNNKSISENQQNILRLFDNDYPIDREIESPLINVQIRIDCDKKLILEELEKLIDSAKRSKEGGKYKQKEKSDHTKLNDIKLIAVCDLLLSCKIEGFSTPTWDLINQVIFDNKHKEAAIKQRYLPLAKRMLSTSHIFSIKTRLNVL